jgi:hypothetical protein
MRRRAKVPVAIGLAAAAVSCNGTTGDAIVTFSAYASGAAGAAQPFSIAGYRLRLTKAQMLLGSVYVDQAPLATGAEGPGCINPGVYTAQVPGGIEADLLSDVPQEFSVFGSGTADIGRSWEIWLTDGDINGTNQAQLIDLKALRRASRTARSFPSGRL